MAALLAACAPTAQPEPVAWSAGSSQTLGAADPAAIFLTWQRDPTTTMTIDWHTAGDAAEPVLQFRRAGRGAWQNRVPQSFGFPFSDRTIHRVEITGLEPGTTYEFRTSQSQTNRTFRTMPRDASHPIRFVTGGDVRHNPQWMEETALQALSYDPDFVVFGGDLAYANGLEEHVDRWYEWFDVYTRSFVTPEGRAVPVLVAIGNHEVRGGYFSRDSTFAFDDADRERIAPYFYRLFAMPGQPGYGVLDFGDYMSVLLLDTDHTNPVDGDQAQWLERTLRERQAVPHLFPVYHVPAYPSVRRFDGEISQRVRTHWVPLFERFGVRIAFENHDHVYKRTYPLRQGQRSPQGIVFLGDGAWGVGVREIGRDQEDGPAWYLERAEPLRHFILGEIHGVERRFIMVDNEGNVFDELPAGAGLAIGAPRFGRPAALAVAAAN